MKLSKTVKLIHMELSENEGMLHKIVKITKNISCIQYNNL